MGGTESVFPHGKIAVKLEKKFYTPGEEVRGKILIGLEKEFPGNSVCLKLQALENSYFRRGGNKHYLGHDCLYSNKTRIFLFPTENTAAGNYEIPFRFPLIKGIPSSVLEESLKFKAEISYMIKGVLQSSNKKKAHNMKNEIHVHVCERPPMAEYHQIKQEDSLAVSSFGCMRKGFSKISIHSPKSVFTNNDVIKFAISVDNTRCLVDLNGFTFHLLSTYELRDDEGYTHHVERVVNMTRVKQKVRAGTKSEEEKPILSNIPMMFPRAKRMEMQSTATGQLVQHRYHVKIIPCFDLIVGGAESIYVPISFYQHAPDQKFETPKEWKVQVMPEKQVQWSEDTKYESKKTSKPAKEEWIRSHSRRMSRVSLKASESTESLGKSKSMEKSRKNTRKMSEVSSSEILFTERAETIQEVKV